MGVFQTIVNVLAYSFSFLTFLSPTPTLFQAARRRDLGEISVVPFVTMTFNSVMWFGYAWLTENFFPLLTTFVCGIVCSASYTIVYWFLTPDKRRVLRLVLLALGGVVVYLVYIALGLSGVTNQSHDGVALTVGFISNTSSLLQYSAPFESIRTVLRSKNASSMPIHLCLVGAIGNSLWVVYAALIDDLIILVPNILCSIVGWIQVAIYMVYRPGRSTKLDMGMASPVVAVGPDAAFTAVATPQPVNRAGTLV